MTEGIEGLKGGVNDIEQAQNCTSGSYNKYEREAMRGGSKPL